MTWVEIENSDVVDYTMYQGDDLESVLTYVMLAPGSTRYLKASTTGPAATAGTGFQLHVPHTALFMPIEEISHLVGHSSTNVTEKIYRKELRPVLTRGARAMDRVFQMPPRDSGSQLGSPTDSGGFLDNASVEQSGPHKGSYLWAILGSNQ